jgi:hypothetical protein
MLRTEYHILSVVGFVPLGLTPSDPAVFMLMKIKELQTGHLTMLAAAGFMVQGLADLLMARESLNTPRPRLSSPRLSL